MVENTQLATLQSIRHDRQGVEKLQIFQILRNDTNHIINRT